jgi:predicted ArsR family transcriptional regulator
VGIKLHETRQKIIAYLKENARATVDELAATVNLTPMAVRYHLNVLQSENLILASDLRRPAAGRGRPQQVYQLTEQADELFPVDYYSLTDYLLDELTIRLGREGISDLFGSIATRLVQEIPQPRTGQTIADRLNQLVAFLSEKGFVSDWEQQNDGSYLIHAYSCPYRQIARDYGHVCQLDQKIIASMLNSKPVRVACLSEGDSHCTYRVPQPIELVAYP